MAVLSFLRRGMKTVLQGEAHECGLASLTMIVNHFGHSVDLSYMRALYPASRKGLSLAEIYQLAATFGLDGRGLAIARIDDLPGLKLPAILHWDGNHFVVLEAISKGTYVVQDPAVGRREFGQEDMARHFSGVAMEFTPRLELEKVTAKGRLGLWDVVKTFDGFRPAFIKILVVSFAVALLSLSTPILLQVALDFVLPQTDIDLLGMLAFGLAMMLIFEALGRWVRDMIILRSALGLQLQFTRSLIGHAFRLPLSFFESRHPGDIVTRLESVSQVKEFAVNGLVKSLADGVTSILIVVMMLFYSPMMTLAVVLTLLAALSVRMLYFNRTQRYTTETLAARSLEASTLYDGLQQVAPLKAQNATVHFERKWYGALTDVAAQDFLSHKTQIDAHLFVHCVTVIGTVATLYMGVGAIMQNTMSIGMLYAFFALRGSFFDKIDTVTTNLMQLSVLSAHMRRLEDIIGETPELKARTSTILRQIRREVRLENVAIQFDAGDRPLLADVNLTLNVDRGESIAIVGESGAGKSSLLKIIGCLMPPSSGSVTVDGQTLDRFGLGEFRNNIGAVFAGDGLVKGTVAENMTLFDPSISVEAMQHALEIVGLSDEVAALPQGLATPITEENSVLSTGQRRRLLAARAVCRAPRLMLFDEITANLDAKTERALLEGLKRMPGAKVFVTHSDRLLDYVDRVFEVANGEFVERKPKVRNLSPAS